MCSQNHVGDISKCPVDHTKFAKATLPKTQQPTGGCPVDHETRSRFSWFRSNNTSAEAAPTGPDATNNALNPLNNMPELSQKQAKGQSVNLPTERTLSTIPRGTTNEEGVWEYPSPQQMFNAMLRKSPMDEIPEDAVESMVDVHNFLNEGAWDEILKWEAPHTKDTKIEPRLLKFTGRPNDMTPRAQMLQLLGKLYPSKYGVPPPFDRHDWTVLRSDKNGGWEQVRYVIDYYSTEENEHGQPTFVLDVRPALDSVGSAIDRFNMATGSVWHKALGLEQPYKKEI